MIEGGMDAILIKVAGIGLTTKHLGKTLVQMQSTLLKLVSFLSHMCISVDRLSQNALYGSHICGEGGEYETLTLDCPVFKYRLHL